MTLQRRYQRYADGHLHLLVELYKARRKVKIGSLRYTQLTLEMDEHRRLAFYWRDQAGVAHCDTMQRVVDALPPAHPDAYSPDYLEHVFPRDSFKNRS